VSVREGRLAGEQDARAPLGGVALSGRRREGPAAGKRTQALGDGSKYTVGVLKSGVLKSSCARGVWHITSSARTSGVLSTSR